MSSLALYGVFVVFAHGLHMVGRSFYDSPIMMISTYGCIERAVCRAMIRALRAHASRHIGFYNFTIAFCEVRCV